VTLRPHPPGVDGAHLSVRQHPDAGRSRRALMLARRAGCRQALDAYAPRCPSDLFSTDDLFALGGGGKDGSGVWTNLTASSNGAVAGFVDYDWAVGACRRAAEGGGDACGKLRVPDGAVLATYYAKAGDWDSAWDPDVHFARSDDGTFRAGSLKAKVSCGNQFEVVAGREVYLARSARCPVAIDGKPAGKAAGGGGGGGGGGPGGEVPGIELYTSVEAGGAWRRACVPVAVRQEGYELVETHDARGTIVVVDYRLQAPSPGGGGGGGGGPGGGGGGPGGGPGGGGGGPDLRAAAAYTAGPRHAVFSLSLANIYARDGAAAVGTSDLARIEGVPGAFFANVMVPRPPGGGGGGGGGSSRQRDRPMVVSRRTFSGGGAWHALPAPQRFNHPRCDRCGGKAGGPGGACHLHLHGASSWFFGSAQVPSAYSHPSAPGLIVGSGNVAPAGEQGLDDNDAICTFVSSDGGATWSDAAEGAWIYEYADWGGVIVMSKHEVNGPADEVRVSTDYGACWRSAPLDEALFVENIRVEPDGQRPRVVVHGRRCRRDQHARCAYGADDPRPSPEGVMYLLDVPSALAGAAGGSLVPQCRADRDYETWEVPAFEGEEGGGGDGGGGGGGGGSGGAATGSGRCLLGARRAFTRRKADVVCVQGGDYVRPLPVNTTCPCSLAADTECDYGFISDGGRGGGEGGSGGGSGSCALLPRERMPSCPLLDTMGGDYTVSSSGRRLVHGDVCAGADALFSDTDGAGQAKHGGRRGGGSGGGGGGGESPAAKRGLFHRLFTLALVVGVLAGAFAAYVAVLAPPHVRERVEAATGELGALGVAAACTAAEVGAMAAGAGRRLLARLGVGGGGAAAGGGGGGAAAAAGYAALDDDLGYFQPLDGGGGRL
jgi:hypothetical protein